MNDKPMKLADIAYRIDAHLRRFEANEKINALDKLGLRPYYNAGAVASGRFVYVHYVAYQGMTHLTREKAELYLAKLDEGFIGRHFEALRK